MQKHSFHQKSFYRIDLVYFIVNFIYFTVDNTAQNMYAETIKRNHRCDKAVRLTRDSVKKERFP
ncbi:hypothetical protein SELSPUOL_01466 [Selenomonas sputigena ATCC 35185]|uniref:Uncharacterized protein n=1 Tax=Selenomonas sputigena (strain ATCC 35185 / DSM 20758 / CCUG 44933 / VPI D19B-28) TaxID=546271 RepID=C9LVH1_SELS3|nr:hypothetical protein SELSPUOL_01466 [Selenomonas sputigena ATCC 35185]